MRTLANGNRRREPCRYIGAFEASNFGDCGAVACFPRKRVKALFELEPRGTIKAKHERPYRMFFLNRLKREFSSDADGRAPHEDFSARLAAAEQSIAVLGSRIAVS